MHWIPPGRAECSTMPFVAVIARRSSAVRGFPLWLPVSGRVETNGHHGYGCACVTLACDSAFRRVTDVAGLCPKPLKLCRADKRLPGPEFHEEERDGTVRLADRQQARARGRQAPIRGEAAGGTDGGQPQERAVQGPRRCQGGRRSRRRMAEIGRASV